MTPGFLLIAAAGELSPARRAAVIAIFLGSFLIFCVWAGRKILRAFRERGSADNLSG